MSRYSSSYGTGCTATPVPGEASRRCTLTCHTRVSASAKRTSCARTRVYTPPHASRRPVGRRRAGVAFRRIRRASDGVAEDVVIVRLRIDCDSGLSRVGCVCVCTCVLLVEFSATRVTSLPRALQCPRRGPASTITSGSTMTRTCRSNRRSQTARIDVSRLAFVVIIVLHPPTVLVSLDRLITRDYETRSLATGATRSLRREIVINPLSLDGCDTSIGRISRF